MEGTYAGRRRREGAVEVNAIKSSTSTGRGGGAGRGRHTSWQQAGWRGGGDEAGRA